MKTLYIIRHAQAEDHGPEGTDYSRRLTDKGHNDAMMIGKQLKSLNFTIPDRWISSTAPRAYETACLIAQQVGITAAAILKEPAMYGAFLPDMLKIIATTPKEVNTLAIIGHNPTFTELGHYCGKHFAKSISKCGVLALQFSANDWQSIKPYTGESLFYVSPKTL